MSPESNAQDRELAALLAALRDGVMVVTTDGEVRYVNSAACELLGRPESQLIGLPFGFPVTDEGDVDITVLPLGREPRVLEMRANTVQWHQEPVYLVVLRDVTEQRRTSEQLEIMARRDGLTGLYNHRTFYDILSNEIARSRRHHRNSSLLMLDIDFFKHVNDNYGHKTGDTVLVEIARRLVREVRDIDCVCRYGGEEFAVILGETDLQGAMVLGERIREQIQACPVSTAEGVKIPVTVSIGAASFPAYASSIDELVKQADTALYRAKRGGRNRMMTADT